MDATLVAVGHGRDRQSVAAARAFVAAWDGQIAVVVDWPPVAASWLRTARRLTASHPDAWVIADTAAGWEHVRAAPARDRELGPDAYRDPAMTDSLFDRPPVEIAPGAVHVPGYLDADRQRRLVDACREWARRMRHTKLPSGGVMSVQTVCLGWHWLPYRYSRTADDVDGAPVEPFPDWLGDLGRDALNAAYGDETPLRARRRADQLLRRPGQDGHAPGQGGARRRAGGQPQHRRHVHLPLRQHRDARQAVHGHRAALGRPVRLRRPVAAGRTTASRRSSPARARNS